MLRLTRGKKRSPYRIRRPSASSGRRGFPLRRRGLPVILAGTLFLWGVLLLFVLTVTRRELKTPEKPPLVKSAASVSQEAPEEPEPSSAPLPEADWNLILISARSPLPEEYEIPEQTELRGGHSVDSRIYPDLQRMMDACRAEGLEPLICSSYRTRAQQRRLFERQQRRILSGEEEQGFWVAPPDCSEHEAALAVDIVDMDYQELDEEQENTPVQRWLLEHCAEYGFILRYPTEKKGLTGVDYEPWHYRYVGEEAARIIMGEGLCLEEYLTR